MKVYYDSGKLKDVCENPKLAKRKLGARTSAKLTLRLNELVSASALSDIPHTPPARLHQLSGERSEHFGVVVERGVRVVFRINQYPIPRRKDGSIDRKEVHEIVITHVGDYHD